MSAADHTKNLGVYRAPEIVAHFAALNNLTACERLLFETHIKPGAALLDLGVGGAYNALSFEPCIDLCGD